MINKIGCHVSMGAPDYLVGSVNEALSYNATCFMIYTGAPQNTRRIDLANLKINEFNEILKRNNISNDDVIVHAPYIINLANNDISKRAISISILNNEIKRAEAIGCKYMVIHPGNNEDETRGIAFIANCINTINKTNNKVVICLETMSGKGNEIGVNFKQIKKIIDLVENKKLIGVCLDTCHVHDSGYEVCDVDRLLKQFDSEIGLDFLKVIHINDSLNCVGCKKDRHANIGKGHIGLTALKKWANHPTLISLPKILETPYVNNNHIYKQEIAILLDK